MFFIGQIYKPSEWRYKVGHVTRMMAIVTILAVMSAGGVAAQQRVVAFGDSLTAGLGLPEAEGFVPRLEAWLQAEGLDVEVVNAGLSGDTTAGGLARVAWVLDGGADLVILELGANDMLRGVSPALARQNLDAILAEITARGIKVLLAGMLAPPNYGAAYKVDFDAIYPDLAEKYSATLYPFFLQGLGAAQGVDELVGLMQSDGIHPNAKGVGMIVEDIGPVVVEVLAK